MSESVSTGGRGVRRGAGRISGVLAALAACFLLLTGCQASVPKDVELLGQWHSVKDGGSITFANGGVCTISEMPNYVLTRLRDETPGDYNGTCTWVIGGMRGVPRDGDGSPIVTITFDPSDNQKWGGIVLKVRGSRDNRTLYYTLDADIDDYYELTLVTE